MYLHHSTDDITEHLVVLFCEYSLLALVYYDLALSLPSALLRFV